MQAPIPPVPASVVPKGAEIEAHRQAGSPPRSRLKAVGMGLAGLVVMVAAIFGVFGHSHMLGTKITIGTKDEVYYRDAATEQQAHALGDALKAEGYLTDRGVTVTLSKTATETTLGFVITDGAWDKPDIIAAFEAIGRKVAPTIGGLPLKIKLMNSDLKVKKELSVTAGR